jgi:hypothetical protein
MLAVSRLFDMIGVVNRQLIFRASQRPAGPAVGMH